MILQSLKVENKAIIIGVMIKIAPSLAKNAERKNTKINKNNINFCADINFFLIFLSRKMQNFTRNKIKKSQSFQAKKG